MSIIITTCNCDGDGAPRVCLIRKCRPWAVLFSACESSIQHVVVDGSARRMHDPCTCHRIISLPAAAAG